MAPMKPSSPKSPNKVHTSFSNKPKNIEVLVTVLLSCKKADAFAIDLSQIDWDLVASRLGLKNSKVASTRFGQVKKELIECAEAITATGRSKSESEDDDTTPTPEALRKIPKSKITKSAPQKRGRGRPKKTAEEGKDDGHAVKKEAEGDLEEEDEE